MDREENRKDAKPRKVGLMDPRTRVAIAGALAGASAIGITIVFEQRRRARIIARLRELSVSPPPMGSPARGEEREVARLQTPITARGLYSLFRAVDPSLPRDALLILVSQSQYETGGWKSCWNWNFGNVTHVKGDGRDWFWSGDKDGAGRPVRHQFVSFPTPEDGARAYLNFLKKHYAFAWSFVLAGDPRGFVHALKSKKPYPYFEGDETTYANAVAANFANNQKIIQEVWV
jgi:hypothetical protein